MSENNISEKTTPEHKWYCFYCSKPATLKCINNNCQYENRSHRPPDQIKICDDCQPRAMQENRGHKLVGVNYMSEKEARAKDWADIFGDMGIDIDVDAV